MLRSMMLHVLPVEHKDRTMVQVLAIVSNREFVILFLQTGDASPC